MQLYDSLGPNPRAARMFLAEKGITIPIKAVDLLAAENRKPPYTDRNPGGHQISGHWQCGKRRPHCFLHNKTKFDTLCWQRFFSDSGQHRG